MRRFHYPKWFQVFYPESVWGFLRQDNKTLYLSFDDGPHPVQTRWVLDCLATHNVKATFFCLGKQAAEYPELMEEIKLKGHQIGNHTMNHLNGFKTPLETYCDDVKEASKYIASNLFRPPYGKLTPKQFKRLKTMGYKTVFWSVLTYDFDQNLNPAKIFKQIKRAKSGDILVFHDAPKAFENLKVVLPETIRYFRAKGYDFDTIRP